MVRVKGKEARKTSLFILKILWTIGSAPFILFIWFFRKFFEYREQKMIEHIEKEESEITEAMDDISSGDIPEFCQFFSVSSEMGIGVEHVEMSPDETAIIRVVGETTFSKRYKRKVYRDKRGQRFFKLNSECYYLRDGSTKPIEPIQERN